MDSSLERPSKRARIACNPCKQKKQKCDGDRPACGNCTKTGRECTVEDPSTRRNLPPNYVELLEARIAQLEGLLRETHPQIGVDHMVVESSRPETANTPQSSSLADAEPVSVNGRSSSSQQVPNPSDGSRPSAFTHASEPSIESLCMAAAVSQPQYYGASSGLNFVRIVGSIMRSVRYQGPGISVSGIRDNVFKNLPKPLPAPLPARVFGDLLSDAYFTHVHRQYPFLHRPTFEEWENNVHFANDNGLTSDPVENFFVYLVYAVGALIVPALCPSSAESLYAAADLCLDQALTADGVQPIQAILCCAMYSMRSSSGVSVWTLSGIALRQCTELGLNKKLVWADECLDLLQQEMRKRVFWVSYNLDRISAVSLGRPVGIADDDIDVEFPSDINDEHVTADQLLAEPRTHHRDPSTTMSAAVHHLRLRRIWGDITTNFYASKLEQTPRTPDYQIADDIHTQLMKWYAECPQPFARTPEQGLPFGTPEWFTLAYDHTVLLLNRHKLVTHIRHGFDSTLDMSTTYADCAHSAARICHTYQDVYLNTKVSSTWGALHILFLAGLTFLYCLWTDGACRRAYRRDAVNSACTACTVALVIITERWSPAQPYRDTFQALVNATQSMLAEQEERGHPDPNLPVLKQAHLGIPEHLSSINAIGMDPSTELLLREMVQR
ncbi:uncharacterized protein HMPREF1541_03233 [Cyphellophora europaea CBS 101466]|uniref:Zn(2)-C6 fungal-type domain-containing protein n=1 Tax=Cyphellophora europaea (strain CBS 101466) TaxID=1220924 RepID=W2RZS8_CYPE1|nr:uncharacterized protein HMPREF1541_03233 [Cyphellophora europaea CBS 101466]ETN41298.1 hypothetical protein HMPREF1541_03233 [Cyphellophora europaea CBS 101466]